jgi:hypothetical protein
MNIKRITTTVERSWAHAYLDDDMGTLMLVTDWGNWTHRWGLHGMPKGVAFSDFIFAGRADFDYITDKLHYGRSDRNEWDEKATKRALRIVVTKAFRRGLCGANSCVVLMREIADAETFDDLMRSDYLDVVPEDCVTKPSRTYLHLRDVILPALQRAYAERNP